MPIRIPINLASEPFRRDRPILVALGAVAVCGCLLLAFQVSTILAHRREAAEIRPTIDRLNAQVRTLDAAQARLNSTLRRPENAEVMERSIFLNTLIERKAISWTRIFADLEKVMPYNVQLVQVRLPEVDSQNQVLLDMVVGAKEVGAVLDLLKRLEASPQFGPVNLQNSQPPSQTDPLFRYHLSVIYAQKL
jgi:outer membrane murein-binding lipoprotein Lpp